MVVVVVVVLEVVVVLVKSSHFVRAALDLRGKLCYEVVAFRYVHGGKASKMMICGVCVLQDPGPKSSQVAERRVTGASPWGIRYPHRYGILSFSL